MAAVNDETGVSNTDLLRLTSDIVAAYVGRNVLAAGALPDALTQVYHALSRLGGGEPVANDPPVRPRPAVPISRSVQHDHIVCLVQLDRTKPQEKFLKVKKWQVIWAANDAPYKVKKLLRLTMSVIC